MRRITFAGWFWGVLLGVTLTQFGCASAKPEGEYFVHANVEFDPPIRQVYPEPLPEHARAIAELNESIEEVELTDPWDDVLYAFPDGFGLILGSDADPAVRIWEDWRAPSPMVVHERAKTIGFVGPSHVMVLVESQHVGLIARDEPERIVRSPQLDHLRWPHLVDVSRDGKVAVWVPLRRELVIGETGSGVLEETLVASIEAPEDVCWIDGQLVVRTSADELVLVDQDGTTSVLANHVEDLRVLRGSEVLVKYTDRGTWRYARLEGSKLNDLAGWKAFREGVGDPSPSGRYVSVGKPVWPPIPGAVRSDVVRTPIKGGPTPIDRYSMFLAY